MRPTRPLVVLPAARALLFAGLAPAPADDYERDRDHRLVAEVLDIDEADADARRTRVSVTSDHECRGDERDLVARVALRQDDVRSTGSCARGFPCNGREQSRMVELRDSGGRLEDGDAPCCARVTTDVRNGRILCSR